MIRKTWKSSQPLARCLVFAFILARSVGAQGTAPGAPTIDASRIRYGALDYVLSLKREGEEEFIGTVRDEILPVRGDDPVIRRVQTVRRGKTVTIDSTVSDASTLAPRWHRTVEPNRDVLLQWADGRVRGEVIGSGSGRRAAKAIDTVYADAFDAANWDLAVRALPLDEGDVTTIEVYDVERQRHPYSVRVVSRDIRGNSYVIHVIVQVDKNTEAHAWFDDVTRTLLRVETQISHDMVLRQVLKP